ncbi:MAG: RNA methyltransferase [Acidobacteriota bacterium]|nr:RNA methyltransferase [Acidobacteriota bacterium]
MKWRVVLVRPRNPLNIGAAARAMANFGFDDLVVVEPFGPVWRETRSAVGAEDIIKTARAAGSLTEVIGDATFVIGTTSGQRRTLDRELMPLGELAAWTQNQLPRARTKAARQAAILFGSEKTGLSNENMSYCHILVRIPTRPQCPSMNLGQAVAVCCYEITREGPKVRVGKRGDQESAENVMAPRERISPPANIQSIDHIFARAARVMDQSGYLKEQSRQAQLLRLRRALIERRLTNSEAKMLGGLLAQIEWKFEHP